MNKEKIYTWTIGLLDIIGVTILIFTPIIFALEFKNPLFLLGYLITWIPAGCLFGMAGYLIELREGR